MITFARTSLLVALKATAPALSERGPMAELGCFWFDDKALFAYNGVIGIETPLESGLSGGVRGSVLLGLLDHSRAREVTIGPSKDGKEIEVKAAGARIKLLRMPRDGFFAFPKPPQKLFIPLDGAFCTVLGRTLVSVGKAVGVDDYPGVSLQSDGDEVNFYSSDGRTMSWGRVAAPRGFGERVEYLPLEFCEQLVSLAKDRKAAWCIEKDYALARLGNDLLFCHLMRPEKLLDYRRAFKVHCPQDRPQAALPGKAMLALERALSVLDSGAQGTSEFGVEEGRLLLHTRGSYGEVRDTMGLENHGNVTALFDPSLVRRILPSCSKVSIGPRSMVLEDGGGFIHVISAVAG